MCDLFKVLIGPMGDGRRNVENVTMVTTRYLLSGDSNGNARSEPTKITCSSNRAV
jgi:hypothetical protein